jgi:c-di-GMP-binding flagellar brake protein YcgR
MKENRTVDSVPESFFCPLGTELVLQFEGSDAQLKSSLVGMERGKYLIIRIPKTPGLEPLLMAGISVKAVFLCDGTIYVFMSTILMSIMSPAPLFFISCPENMQRHELRKNLRMDCSIPAVIREKEKMEYNGIITDLSSGGCGVTVPNAPQVNADFKVDGELELSCEMLGIEQDTAIHGIIKNLSQDDKRIHLGLQFDPGDARALERIQIYVNRILDIVH